MTSWFWKKGSSAKSSAKGEENKVVVDGSRIEELVGNKETFNSYVDHKFQELDLDQDGKLSMMELRPAVADIGAALGLPAQGSSAESDNIYSEVLNEFTHGQQVVSKSEFKEVLSDILMGMAAGLKRDPIVILRINGEDLKEFIESSKFEPEAISIFSQMESKNITLRECIANALGQLHVDQGMPPASDSWVLDNIVEPVFQSFPKERLEMQPSQEIFLEEFKKFLYGIIGRLGTDPAIVAHSETTFDGKSIKRILSNKFELDKLLDSAWKELPKDHKQKVSKDYFRVALDSIAPSADLPPYGSVPQVQKEVKLSIIFTKLLESPKQVFRAKFAGEVGKGYWLKSGGKREDGSNQRRNDKYTLRNSTWRAYFGRSRARDEPGFVATSIILCTKIHKKGNCNLDKI